MTPWTKRLAIALAISFAANLLLIGFFVGRAARGEPRHGPLSDDARLQPELRHPLLRNAVEGRSAEFKASRKAAINARNAVREALIKEPFDAPLLERALADLRSQTGRAQEFAHKALLEAATRGTPETRRDLARAFGRKRARPH